MYAIQAFYLYYLMTYNIIEMTIVKALANSNEILYVVTWKARPIMIWPWPTMPWPAQLLVWRIIDMTYVYNV